MPHRVPRAGRFPTGPRAVSRRVRPQQPYAESVPRSPSAFTLPVLIAGSLLAAGTVVCCSSPAAEPVSAPPASPSPAPGPSATPVDEPPGAIACDKAVRAVSEASLMNPGVVADITTASGTADAPVADAAQALS